MGGSNSSPRGATQPAPFLTYLTVFKSRLGLGNIILGITEFGHQPDQALLRKLQRILDERRDLDVADVSNGYIFDYLITKRIVGPELRSSGRYKGYALRQQDGKWIASARGSVTLDLLPVYTTDIWMAHPEVPSTIGVPTPDNREEIFEFAFQLKLLARSKNTWTAAGQMVHGLRRLGEARIPDPTNPFLLGSEALGLLRQLVENDGLLLRELLRVLVAGPKTITRDAVAGNFHSIVEAAVGTAKDLQLPQAVVREGLAFLKLIETTTKKAASASRAPGVLEHRVAPRLEWLTDLGYLSKDGIEKNSFEYRVTEGASLLLEDLDRLVGTTDWADEVAVSQWLTNPSWTKLRNAIAQHSQEEAIIEGYRIMKRRVGPAPLREVALASSLFVRTPTSFSSAVESLIQFAQETEGASLSGGRYSRAPENIYLSDSTLPSE